jgi:hypothetical protein
MNDKEIKEYIATLVYEWNTSHETRLTELEDNIELKLQKLNGTETSINNQINNMNDKLTEFESLLNRMCNIETFGKMERVFTLYERLLETVEEWREQN